VHSLGKNIEINIQNTVNAGLKTVAISESTKEEGSILGQGFKSLGYLILNMFFVQNKASKKMEFSFGNTLFSLFHVAQIGFMFFLLLKDQDSEDSGKSGSRSFKSDKFYL
jgi:hypothetical protein